MALSSDQLAILWERDSHLVRLIEAITALQSTDAWSTLKEEFDGEVAKLNRHLLTESKKSEVNLPEVYRFQGRIEAAKKYSFESLLASYRFERESIRKQLL